ncbi:hypothetical protein [Bacillus horti]|uniref:Phr family secreted Rap phosphatase inhibitor n=1 Tax=Caldalkalibacillus horti TaxID=77523 RepID=A0ABT9W445_9BACI|nr:hypothetical protein [Bacillus horti]MDQ0167999.1 hypothetical protein [Bacillus horti]
MKKILTLMLTSSLVFFVIFSGATEVLGNPAGPVVDINSVKSGHNI